MSTLLVLKSSILGEHSQSNQLIDAVIAGIDNIIVRDLTTSPLPILDGETIKAINSGDDLTGVQKEIQDLSNTLVEELKQADTLLIGAPMYNFMVPTQLKNWFDLLARAGVTFSYTAQGPKGMLEDKKVIIVTTRGGIHKDGETDHVTGYLTTLLGFFGITSVKFVYAEGLNLGDDLAANSLELARSELTARM
ncbi:FMN-dependent NADH-azoreductase [Photobacterium angustum]|uniref:FMN dependent NADH:quinone oxidoreductase n=1 Tax=Photobacterium angustum TaxID=661 RepID=A0ABX5H624_PHOAN|nr:FMN-dependent NADH-azoreductase [Photobacterium angustum]KJG39711.1 FMN-dependent NADH-azoreductase [Photobacterium angustum]PSX11297.1 FMN-dependent NADH-azoreductase [Photobacterium angustum]